MNHGLSKEGAEKIEAVKIITAAIKDFRNESLPNSDRLDAAAIILNFGYNYLRSSSSQPSSSSGW